MRLQALLYQCYRAILVPAFLITIKPETNLRLSLMSRAQWNCGLQIKTAPNENSLLISMPIFTTQYGRLMVIILLLLPLTLVVMRYTCMTLINKPVNYYLQALAIMANRAGLQTVKAY